MENLEKYIYEKLSTMQEEKAKSTTVPNMVTKTELFSAVDKDVRSILNKWFKNGTIKVHKTIHAPIHDYVELVKE